MAYAVFFLKKTINCIFLRHKSNPDHEIIGTNFKKGRGRGRGLGGGVDITYSNFLNSA